MNCLNVYNKSLKKKGVLSITSAEKKRDKTKFFFEDIH